MKNKLTPLAAFAMAFAISGCSVNIGGGAQRSASDADWRVQQEQNREYIHHLEMGTSIGQVERDLGLPHFSEAFARGNNEYRVHFYRTHHMRSDGKTTRDETTPVVFENGYLIGWGEFFHQELVGLR